MLIKKELYFLQTNHKNYLSSQFKILSGFIRTFKKWTYKNVQNRIFQFQFGGKISNFSILLRN